MKRKFKRNILLIEPNYKNKYPPIGLMKLATYHRKIGDNVVFYKGDLKIFIINNITKELLIKLEKIDNEINWRLYKNIILEYIKTGKRVIHDDLISKSKYGVALSKWLIHYKDYYRKQEYLNDPKWDRIYITTLFTFHWKITIETIEFAKKIVKDIKEVYVGGVLATVLADDVKKTTGIKVHKGLLNKKNVFDKNDIVIDELPLDYSILEEIEYEYPENNAYYGYTTRGCIRKCSFCAVPQLEPEFNSYITIKEKIKHTNRIYGKRRNLLLLDNNVLASERFHNIINEIKEIGFTKDSLFIEPNNLDIAITNLKKGINNRAYINKSFKLIHYLLNKVKKNTQQNLYNLLDEYDLLKIETATKENILSVYPKIKDLFEKFRNKTPKHRYVDFNQGVDVRLINEDKMKLLSEIPINPLRIAFDNMKFKKFYVKAIELATQYGIRNLSNYLLYNEKDKPEELYQRLEININLCEDLDVNIFSFPMKFHPINGKKWYMNRDYLGKHWNRKFIRAIQTILNSTKGKIGRGKSFFYKAFGNNVEEYFKILYMPETYILFRYFFEDKGYTEKWWKDFNRFSDTDKNIVQEIIESNEFKNISRITSNSSIMKFIKEHYLISREDIKNTNSNIYIEKKEYDELKNKSSQLSLEIIREKKIRKIA